MRITKLRETGRMVSEKSGASQGQRFRDGGWRAAGQVGGRQDEVCRGREALEERRAVEK